MNEENNKKRNKIIIIVAVLFLLTAGIMTVYSFKNTKAEEINGEIVDSSSLFVSPTVSCPTGFEMQKGASGCVMNANTLKKIPGFAMRSDSIFVNFGTLNLNKESSFGQTTKSYDRYVGNDSTTVLKKTNVGFPVGEYDGYFLCNELKCFEIKITSAYIGSQTSNPVSFDGNYGVYRSSDNYYIYTPGGTLDENGGYFI